MTAELEQAGYPGPWDVPAQVEAYVRASGGPVTCGGPSQSGRPTTVVMLVAGYGSDLTSASVVFSPLQSALLARDPTTSFAFFSYRGSDVRGCASVPTPYSPEDTAQSLDASVALFITTLQALQSSCPADIAVVGHSLGGLIAFRALGERPNARVKSVITVDSPLGGSPLASSTACIELGFCAGWPRGA